MGGAHPVTVGAGLTMLPLVQDFEWMTNVDSSCELRDKNDTSRGLVVEPRRGTAIVWLNHQAHTTRALRHSRVRLRAQLCVMVQVSAEGVVSGELDWPSIHGGCDVQAGEKFVANQWITGGAMERHCGKHGPTRREMLGQHFQRTRRSDL